MAKVIVEVSKYVMMILFALYTLESFLGAAAQDIRRIKKQSVQTPDISDVSPAFRRVSRHLCGDG